MLLWQRRCTGTNVIIANPVCSRISMPANGLQIIKIVLQSFHLAFRIVLADNPPALPQVHMLKTMNQPGLIRGRIGHKVEFAHGIRTIANFLEHLRQQWLTFLYATAVGFDPSAYMWVVSCHYTRSGRHADGVRRKSIAENHTAFRQSIQIWCSDHFISRTPETIPSKLVGGNKQYIWAICHLPYSPVHSTHYDRRHTFRRAILLQQPLLEFPYINKIRSD